VTDVQAQLRQINDEFLIGAEGLRYSYMVPDRGELFAMTSRNPDPLSISVYRTIKYADKNKYLFVVDIDGTRFNNQTLSAGFKVRHIARKKLHMHLQPKASGMKGNQLLCDISFPETYGPLKCLEGLARVAYSLWEWSGVEKMFDVGFGLGLEGVYIDACMYKKGRIVRSFSKHLKSGLYSVPYEPNDPMSKIKSYMKLEEELPWPVIHDYAYLDIAEQLEEYTDKYYFESKGQAINDALLERLDGMDFTKRRGRPDAIYSRMPKRLQQIVNMDADIMHDMKWPLTAYLWYQEEMEPEDIIQWFFKNCKWCDLKNLDITTYQVSWTCNSWANKVLADGGNPVPRWVYG